MTRRNGRSSKRRRGTHVDAWFMLEGKRIQRLLRRTKPSPNFGAGEIGHMDKMVQQVMDELAGRRALELTLNRPLAMTSFMRSYNAITFTPEGRRVYDFFALLAERAQAIDLPLRDMG